MRIISGKYKGRVIRMPKGIRPTQDKVRKALFDILGDIEGLSFLELFAGSAAVGLEALSRGARDLTLVESERYCLATIKENIESLKLSSACSLYPGETRGAIETLYKDGRRFDIIFIDPPYYGELAKKILQTLSACDILTPDGLMVVQHFKKENLPETLGVLTLLKRARYGDTVLSFYNKEKTKAKTEAK